MRSLPTTLKMRVASFQYSDVLKRNSYLFQGCNNQFLNQLMIVLREVYLMPGEVVMQARPTRDAIRQNDV